MPRTAKGKKTPPKKVFKTSKKCILTAQNIEYVDYKDYEILKRFISSKNGKIKPRRITGLSAKYQRKVTKAIKQAREVGLLPFVIES
jgi:small subunit ribosomal protein S18